MRNRGNTAAYIVFGLIGVGILVNLLSNPRGILVPLIVFGGIFLLYKFPPNRWGKSRGYGARPAKGPKRKNAKFRVIQGSKPDGDEPPKYH
ncbi:hypothetical protein [Paenibacillus mucilaginosus]|uniref:Uncharacterized protein n=3 Tax=Paenibacillus mucilaginosus TaxID=61624 RepID=H6NL51_9BACL|nr:hypothetical protein [Paenibacillus mucilaginosus]AEI41204.1 hypothetical protein KNP414_02643 [Paenibacillus mucilaginosus KNP414]AFC29758.1 hypothetical protein PM3016_2886 [Paenibacillus mucilaginosus 3016]AFH61944.1 hypothetical protein B2K_14660 [Paenibacillus mucilaginosus K02]MCG7211371.1 hypothetical protein [Paenibacillus mucilaginosus]WDM30246.1 hypothetical protein KCX80_14330 [Paenibacillus mucilaginosus]